MENHLKPIDQSSLYEKREIIDIDAGLIVMLVPVDKYGTRDPARQTRYFSNIVAAWNGQPIPVEFEILIDGVNPLSLSSAIAEFPACAKEAGEKRISDLESQMLKNRLTGGLAAAGSPH